MSTLTSSSLRLPSLDLQNAVLVSYKPDTSTKHHGHTLHFQPKPIIDTSASINHLWPLSGVVLLLHGAITLAYLNYPENSATPTPKINKVEIEFIKPTPPQVIEPPKPPPPMPKVIKQTPPATKPAPALRTAIAQDNVAPDVVKIPENHEAPVTSTPVAAAPPPPEVPTSKVEETITAATGNAAYLNNPSPDYPAFAQRQGWEGNVLLRVHVLANGKPDKVEIKQSSGRKTLDESALTAVKNWTFIPSKRGNTAIDGWATVPIEFKLAK